ncbi:hypothetical protein CWR43_13280 [Rhizobium sullae]|uniref:Uncharacterized protein n=1 Tax=Rhizobium sullae TaxID=50338 RepID=A0A2N0DA95_RHISU|nr:hypothetical protein CWR43_13280 [Rhizobium sullae]
MQCEAPRIGMPIRVENAILRFGFDELFLSVVASQRREARKALKFRAFRLFPSLHRAIHNMLW